MFQLPITETTTDERAQETDTEIEQDSGDESLTDVGSTCSGLTDLSGIDDLDGEGEEEEEHQVIPPYKVPPLQ